MVDLGAIEENVPFDAAAADALIAACNGAASLIDGQAGARSRYVDTAMKDFRGRFSGLFSDNAAVARGDARELVERLHEVAQGASRLKQEAAKEQKRRETARAWKQKQDHRNFLEKGWDSVFGEDSPPVGPPASPVSIPVAPAVTTTRRTPAPGAGGGGGGGTSSARPSDLHSFATSSAALNHGLRPSASSCKSSYAHFGATCHWGSLDAGGVFSGFDAWLAANDNDVRWANVVGDAFARAGGEGSVSRLADSAIAATLRSHGVDAARQDLTIVPPAAFGHPPTTGYAVDPVNTATGNFVETESDLGFAGGCAALAFTRTYNSVNAEVGAFGPGWSSWTESGLRFDDDGAAFVMPDGREVAFPRSDTGWGRAVGESLWLAGEGEQFVVSASDGMRWRFSREGRLLERSAGAGTAIGLTWAEGRLVELVHERGRAIALRWEGDRVVGLRASDGREVGYGYDGSGRLVAATTALGTRSYRWNGQGIVSSVIDADGVVEVENAYDEHGRVSRQRTVHGRLVRFVYLPGRVTVVSDEDGSRSNTWIADERGRLVGVVDADEHRQSMAYDPYGNVVMVTERDGEAVVNEYDERGRLVRRVLPGGADLAWTWDAHDRVTGLRVSDPDERDEPAAELSYGYHDDDRNPALLVDAEGGRTQLTWEQGLLTHVCDPTGVTVAFTYDEHGDLVGTTDADGNTARLERDASGRVVAAYTPSGHVTRFAYDERTGLLARRVDPDGAEWQFEHTAAGRLAVTIDPLGARTELEYGEDGEEQRTIDPLGRSLTRHVDDLGNLASVELPDGTSWHYAHDALSRLVSTTAPDGATWTQRYDANGGLATRTGPTGESFSVTTDVAAGTAAVTEPAGGSGMPAEGAHGPMTAGIRIDRLGRLIATERPDGSTVLTRYDRCGRAVEMVDAGGGVTVVRRDAAGRAVELIRPGGGTVRYSYDACGRLVAVVDELGARTELRYDADGRLVTQVLPTGDEASWGYDACGRVIRRRVPGVGTTTVSYDASGRVVESRDPQLGRRRFCYDAAGQLVAAVNGNGGVTRWEYDANGRAVTIVDADGGITRREFDARNHVVGETDPLGRRTTAGYDEAGRQIWQVSPDGERTDWTYDAAGRPTSVLVDGRLVAAIERDVRGRSVRIADHTRPERVSIHELRWDARGLLVSRTRDGRGLSWEYDPDGRRVARTGPDGDRVGYQWDLGGRLTAITHPLLGRATFSHDAAGRVLTASTETLQQRWTYDDGFISTHVADRSGQESRTVVDRDGVGRVVALNRDGVHTVYSYDEACQLIEARTGGQDGAITRWRYDAAGRLVAESRDGSTRELSYDAAGQLVSTVEPDGRVRRWTYDGQGRRTSVADADGARRSFTWAPTGWLAGVTDQDADGEQRQVTTIVDALGELARLDDAEVFFDTADRGAPALAQVGDSTVIAAGAVTGVDGEWVTPGWRGVRTDGDDPWAAPTAGIGPAGELAFAGLEWLGARVYDPSVRGFLSVDPLDPLPGAGWAGNPYSYAGNDPLNASDPTGLRPATDADLRAWSQAHQGAIHAAGQWLEHNWEYVAGGAMVVAGGVLIATGVGGPAGMMLVSAGADTIIQKATTGHVNWGEVAISGAMGAWGAEGAAVRLGAKTALQRAVVGGMVSGGASGGVGSAYTYASGPGPHSVTGFLEATGTGVGMGAASGGALGGAGHGLANLAHAGRTLGDVAPTPAPPPAPLSSSKELVPYWPANRGALGDWSDTHLLAGTHIDRYGYPGGTFVSPEGTPYQMRALPAGSDGKPYHVYEVVKPIPVRTSTVAPAFGELGLGTQHELPMSVEKLVHHGILKVVK